MRKHITFFFILFSVWGFPGLVFCHSNGYHCIHHGTFQYQIVFLLLVFLWLLYIPQIYIYHFPNKICVRCSLCCLFPIQPGYLMKQDCSSDGNGLVHHGESQKGLRPTASNSEAELFTGEAGS